MKKIDVIQSMSEPKNTKALWLSPKGLKIPTNKGWKSEVEDRGVHIIYLPTKGLDLSKDQVSFNARQFALLKPKLQNKEIVLIGSVKEGINGKVECVIFNNIIYEDFPGIGNDTITLKVNNSDSDKYIFNEDGNIQAPFNTNIEFLDLYGNVAELWNINTDYTELPDRHFINLGNNITLYQSDWSYTLEKIKGSEQPLSVGALYKSLGYTLMIADMPSNNLTLKLPITGTFEIDWGDSTTDSTAQHTYTESGIYHIKITGTHSFAFSTSENRIKTIISNATGNVYRNCGAKTIVLPNTLSALAANSFRGCNNLNTLILPKSVTSIGKDAIRESKIKNLILNEGLKTIGDDFVYKVEIDSLFIPKSVTTIGAYMGYSSPIQKFIVDKESDSFSSENGILYDKNKTKLVKYPEGKLDGTYIMPDTVTTLADFSTFNTQIKNFIMSDNVTTIPNQTFGFNSKLETIKLSNNLESIGAMAFYGCEKLKELTLPDSVVTINNQIIQGSGVEVLTFGKGVKTLVPYFAYNALNLKEFKVDKENPNFETIKGILYNKDITTLIKYPEGKTCGTWVVPYTVTKFNDDACTVCPVNMIIFPEDFTTIGNECFYQAITKILDFSKCKQVVTYGENAFTDSSLKEIVVPDKLYNDYIRAWDANKLGLEKLTITKRSEYK